MEWKQIAEICPYDVPSECPSNCIDCEHLKGVIFHSWGYVEVQCDLDEYIIDCMISKK